MSKDESVGYLSRAWSCVKRVIVDLRMRIGMAERILVDYMSHIWLIGTLFQTGRRTLTSALYEFLYLVVWSILPFALGTLVLYVTSNATDKDFLALSLNTVQNGELLVFTISMLAPILYLTLHDPEEADPFPHKLPISTIVALIIVTCAALFALMKSAAVKDGPFVFNLSVLLTIVALVIRYLAIAYHKGRLPQVTERELRAPQDTFVSEFRQHIEGEQQPSAGNFAQQFQNHLKGEQ